MARYSDVDSVNAAKSDQIPSLQSISGKLFLEGLLPPLALSE